MLREDRSDEESAIGISAKRKPFDSSSMVVVIRAISMSSGHSQYPELILIEAQEPYSSLAAGRLAQ